MSMPAAALASARLRNACASENDKTRDSHAFRFPVTFGP
jgi:hypothetical protein